MNYLVIVWFLSDAVFFMILFQVHIKKKEKKLNFTMELAKRHVFSLVKTEGTRERGRLCAGWSPKSGVLGCIHIYILTAPCFLGEGGWNRSSLPAVGFLLSCNYLIIISSSCVLLNVTFINTCSISSYLSNRC